VEAEGVERRQVIDLPPSHLLVQAHQVEHKRWSPLPAGERCRVPPRSASADPIWGGHGSHRGLSGGVPPFATGPRL
jgi:hypothetical protein